jgi:hypothetical protein
MQSRGLANLFFMSDCPQKEFIALIKRPARSEALSRGSGCHLVLVSPVVIAVGVAMDPACGIAKAEFPAAFIVAVVRAELRPVKSGK